MNRKIFFGLSGGAGPMIRCLPIAIELSKQGDDIFYYSRDYSKHYMDLYGFTQIEIPYGKKYDAGIGITDKWVDLEHFAACYENEEEYFIQKYSTWVHCMQELEPDIIVSDFSLGSTIAGLVLGIPVVSISQACYLYPTATNTRIRWWDDVKKPEGIKILSNLNNFMRRYGKKEFKVFEEVFMENKVFIPSIPEFDSLINQDNVEYVGPILWNEEKTQALAEYKKDIVFVYTGRLTDTCGDTGIQIYNLMKEAAKETDNIYIFSNGNFEEIKQPSIDNVYVMTEWCSVEEIYTRSKLVIHHGGHNSCLASLIYGTPSICLPTHTEREFNARKMAEMGVGITLNPNETQKQHIIDAITNVQYQNKTSAVCAEWRKKIRARNYGGVLRIVEYINSIM